jgi:hypothetical protein
MAENTSYTVIDIDEGKKLMDTNWFLRYNLQATENCVRETRIAAQTSFSGRKR